MDIIPEKVDMINNRKGGVFWHTQGSGKSLSMVFYAHLLQEALNSPTIVVMTDRIDLDDQLYTQFAKCAPFLRQIPVQASCLYKIPAIYNVPIIIARIGSAAAYGIFFCNILFLWLVFVFLVNSIEKSV